MSKVIKSSQGKPRGIVAYERGDLGLADPVAEEVAEWAVPDPAVQAQAEAEKRLQDLYSEGLRRGIEAGKAEFEKVSVEAVGALRTAADAMLKAREEFLASLEPQVLNLIEAMVLRILEREALLDPQVVVHTVRTALSHLADRERFTVYLNPADVAAIRAHGLDPFAGIEGLGEVELAGDVSVGPGGCLVTTDAVQIDARLEKQLEQILQALAQ